MYKKVLQCPYHAYPILVIVIVMLFHERLYQKLLLRSFGQAVFGVCIFFHCLDLLARISVLLPYKRRVAINLFIINVENCSESINAKLNVCR